MRLAGDCRDGAPVDGPADQLPDHGQLPGLPAARGQARRRLDGRRPPLLQQPRRPVRLRDDQPPARLSEAHRLQGARLRPLPAHGLGLRPRRAAAAVREGVQGSDQDGLLGDGAPEGDQGDHHERGGRRRRRRAALGEDRALVRALRVLAAARPLLPVQDRAARGRRVRLRARREHQTGRAGVLQPRCRGTPEGDRRGHGAQAEGRCAASARDDDHGAERQRCHRLGLERRRTCSGSAATS